MEIKKTTLLSALVCVAGVLAEVLFHDTFTATVVGVVLSVLLSIIILSAAYFAMDGFYSLLKADREADKKKQEKYEQRIYTILNELLQFEKAIYKEVRTLQQMSMEKKAAQDDKEVSMAAVPLEIEEIQEKVNILQQLGKEIKTAQDDIKAAQGGIETAQDDIKAAQGGIETAQNDIKTAQGGIETAQNDIKTVQDDIRTAQDGIQTAQDDIKIVQVAIKTAQDDIKTTQGGIEAAQDDIKTAQGGIEAAQDDIKTAQGGIEAVQDDIKTAQGGIQSVQDDIRTVQNDIQSAGSDAEAVPMAAAPSELKEIYEKLQMLLQSCEEIKEAQSDAAGVSMPVSEKAAEAEIPEEVLAKLRTSINENTTMAAKIIVKYVDRNTGDLKALLDQRHEEIQKLVKELADSRSKTKAGKSASKKATE